MCVCLFRLQSYDEWLQTAVLVAWVGGSFLGTAVLPLDWNRPWQYWPIPNVLAALVLTVIVLAVGPFIYEIILKKSAGIETTVLRVASSVKSSPIKSPAIKTEKIVSSGESKRSVSPVKESTAGTKVKRNPKLPVPANFVEEDKKTHNAANSNKKKPSVTKSRSLSVSRSPSPTKGKPTTVPEAPATKKSTSPAKKGKHAVN